MTGKEGGGTMGRTKAAHPPKLFPECGDPPDGGNLQ